METNLQRREQPGQWGGIVPRLIALGAVALALSLGPAPVARAATFTVTNSNDSGAGSLRQAILDANTTAGADIITFSVSGTITLGSFLIINDDVTIDGSGQSITMSGSNAVQVMRVHGCTTNLMNLTVANGSGGQGGGIEIDRTGTLIVSNSTFSGNSGVDGGGIENFGTLTVSNSTFSGNSATNNGGGIHNDGITLTVSNSTFSGNNASGDGGGIFNGLGTLTVSNSTFSGNSAINYGGGIRNLGGTLTVSNSTFSGNSASTGGGIMSHTGQTVTVINSTFAGNGASGGAGSVGGILTDGFVFLRNTIIANSPSGQDCQFAGGLFLQINNLIEDGSCSPLLSGDPNLGPLANNGGPTQTHALLAGSPAIDAGDNATCAAAPVNNLDQRGVTRLSGAACDIGAFEREQPAVSLSPASLNFGNQLVGTTSTAQTVTLAKSGNALLTINDISTSGDYAQANDCASSLAAGASCTINVTFTPSATGNRTGTLTINDDAAGNPHTVALSGTGTAPIANLSPASLSFGNQLVGTTGAAQLVTLSNSGSAPLTISGITASGDFAQTNDCGSSLAAGASCTINVTFTPTATGNRTGMLTINDNAVGSPHTVALNGSGILSADLALSLGADQNPVRSGTNLTYLITVKNAGPTIASGVVVSEPLPAGTTFVSATPSQGSCITPAPGAIGTMTCNLGGMANSATATVTLVVRVTAAGGATLSNTASVSASSPDPNSTNNAATLTTRVFGTKH